MLIMRPDAAEKLDEACFVFSLADLEPSYFEKASFGFDLRLKP